MVSGHNHSPDTFSVTGMTCDNCARHVNEAIQTVPGVRSATVNLEAGQATVRWAADTAANAPEVIQAIEKAGYSARVLTATEHSHPRGRWQWNLILGLAVTVPLMIAEWFLHLGMQRWFQWISFLLAGVVQIFCGARFYVGAWKQLKAGRSNMDTLVALGSTTAFGYSTWALFAGWSGHLYFMEAAAIITLISVGHWMESRASSQASTALQNLLHLAPQTARRNNPDGAEVEVPAAELNVGDIVTLRPGDRIPTDGKVAGGNSTVDESMLTGESVPLDNETDDALYAGTVNVNGKLLMRVTATGEATALAHIIEAVQRAQSSRANIQRLGDKVSSVFVPVVVLTALAAAIWWGIFPEQARSVHDVVAHFLWHAPVPQGAAGAFIIAAAVLIVACPCAMGLATPAAIMAGSNAAAQRGILIRDGVALEKAGQVTAVVFDKTGTLTIGKPLVVHHEMFPCENTLPDDALKIAAALAGGSSHPLSQAVSNLATEGVAFANWSELRGAGVQADYLGMKIRLGSLKWLAASEIDLSNGNAFFQEWSARGATLLGFSINNNLCGIFALIDALKTGSADVVRQLQSQKLTVYMITGDNPLTAASIAGQVGIARENVFAEVRPEQKAEHVKQLQARGERVAFIGDGINDAPALEQADLGIAVSRASDVAREAADIILLKSEIEAVPEALGLARATLRTIKQNLFWAFFYNAAGVPLAALGFLSPVLCAAAMGLSDLIVIGNALRLRYWRRAK